MSFAKLFGGRVAKVLDVLSVEKEKDFSMTEIARLSGMSYRTMQRIFPALVSQGLVKKTRNIGRAEMYKINLDNLKMFQLHKAVYGTPATPPEGYV
jgi:predicted transcriptional regulator